jgi:hypothetical protein
MTAFMMVPVLFLLSITVIIFTHMNLLLLYRLTISIDLSINKTYLCDRFKQEYFNLKKIELP